MDLDSAFQLLEIEKSADINGIRGAYRNLIEIWHPDKYVNKPRLAERAAAKMKE
jgi:DnaJ-class molecular chaperone